MVPPVRTSILLLAAVCTGACASTGGVPRPFPAPGGHGASAPPAPSSAPATAAPAPSSAAAVGYAIAGTALSLRGAPYRNGGSDPRGFDCSGFVLYVFSQNGLSVPRTVTDQYHAGQPVPSDHLEPGDLVFFQTVAPGASHVGIAIGGDEFIHAPSERGEVRVERLSSSYWGPRYLGARRLS